MTFWAQRGGQVNTVDVHVTSGPVSVIVTEEARNLRNFHTELGKLLDVVEQADSLAQRAKESGVIQ
jgi:hypothetical protein